MIIPIIDRHTLAKIRNPCFAAYAEKYVDIHEDFLRQVEATGMPLAPLKQNTAVATGARHKANSQGTYRNDGKSIYLNDISPACVACQQGIGSVTFFISFMCNRNCWFCFNPNEENYHIFSRRKRNCRKQLAEIHEAGLTVHQVGLTGGEPLLHKPDMLAFFRDTRVKFPEAYTRLYTCGDSLDEIIVRDLAQAGLNEIRFSIKVDELRCGNRNIFDKIALAKKHIPRVMVEMPVIPGTLELMKGVLTTLDRLQIFGVNLLEFCFPFHNARTYQAKGFQIKNPPYRVLYNYDYSGGLPIAGSEEECLALLEFACDEQLKLGIHYCSLENKLTAQIYQQNLGHQLPDSVCFSQKDYFLKTAKVFGNDIHRVRRILNRKGTHDFSENDEAGYLEFHVDDLKAVQPRDIEVALCSNVVERRAGGRYLRELQVAFTTPQLFDRSADV